jgi:hypothetical protein
LLVLAVPAVSTARAGATTLPSCARQVARPVASPNHASGGKVLPARPVQIRLCRYVAVASRGALMLRGQQLVRAPIELARIARRLGALPDYASGVTACPADSGAEIVGWARLVDGRRVKLTVATSGCPWVRRGLILRAAGLTRGGQALLRELRLLTA